MIMGGSRSRSNRGIGLMKCFPIPKKGRDSEHWDVFKQKYPTDSFAKTSLYGKGYVYASRRNKGMGQSLIKNVFG